MKKYDAKLLVHHVNLKHRFEDRSQVELEYLNQKLSLPKPIL